jgi:hypothetical protein
VALIRTNVLEECITSIIRVTRIGELGTSAVASNQSSVNASKSDIIPESRKADHNEAKAYCPISLSPFLLKMMEKLADRHIRDSALRTSPRHQNKHAYQTGISNQTVLHNVTTCIQNANEHKAICLRAFLTTEETLDRTLFDTIKLAAERHGIESTICRWICFMQESIEIIPTLSEETFRAFVAKGCP